MDNNFSGLVPTDDQFFLLYFITGTYFGPDLLGEYPKKSVLQRKYLGLPPYTSNELAGSCLRTIEVERVYYHALRKADRSVVLAQPWLHQFFHGKLPTLYHGQAAAYPRFCDLFPSSLHPHLCCDVYNVIANIVFINDPDTSYISPDDVKRFKKLTCLAHLIMDKDCAESQAGVDCEALSNVGKQEVSKPGDIVHYPSIASSSRPYKEMPCCGEAFSGDFSSEVESDGKVLIKGLTTTGDRTVRKYSQAFEMQTQNLCPTGQFSISFKLPGPVDPQQFSGNFGTDGILEGIVMKAERK